MADAGILERRGGTPLGRLILAARRLLACALVLVATFAGGYLALVGFTQTKTLSVGAIRLSMSPGPRGAREARAAQGAGAPLDRRLPEGADRVGDRVRGGAGRRRGVRDPLAQRAAA